MTFLTDYANRREIKILSQNRIGTKIDTAPLNSTSSWKLHLKMSHFKIFISPNKTPKQFYKLKTYSQT
jgi:hypothetical protein